MILSRAAPLTIPDIPRGIGTCEIKHRNSQVVEMPGIKGYHLEDHKFVPVLIQKSFLYVKHLYPHPSFMEISMEISNLASSDIAESGGRVCSLIYPGASVSACKAGSAFISGMRMFKANHMSSIFARCSSMQSN